MHAAGIAETIIVDGTMHHVQQENNADSGRNIIKQKCDFS